MTLRLLLIFLFSFSIVEAKSLVITVFKSNDFAMKEQLHLQNHLSMIVSKILSSEWKLITSENISSELDKNKNLSMEDCVGDCSLSIKKVLGAEYIFICRVMDMNKFMNVSIELYDKKDNLVDVVSRDLLKSMSDILKIKRSMSFIIDKFRKYFPRNESYESYDFTSSSFGNEASINKSNSGITNVIRNRSSASKILDSLRRSRGKRIVRNKTKLPLKPSKKNIVKVMRSLRVKSCVNRDPYRRVNSRKLRIRIIAVSSGEIVSAEVLNSNSYSDIVVSCIKRGFKRKRFEAFRNDSVSFIFPFKL